MIDTSGINKYILHHLDESASEAGTVNQEKFWSRKFSSIKIPTQHIFVTSIIDENFLTE